MEDFKERETAEETVPANLPEEPDPGLPPPPGGKPDEVSGVEHKRDGIVTIQPDCLVQITVEEDPSLDGSYPVNSIGAIEFGRIGPVFLINRTESEAEDKVREVLLNRDLKKATVSVNIVRASYDKVRISGDVNKPGLIKIGAGDSISLNDALRRGGGLRTSSRGARVRIVRDGLLFAIPDVSESEEYRLMSDEGKPAVPDVALRNNDIAYVFHKSEGKGDAVGAKRVIVLGEVKRPGVYTFPRGSPCTIMHLIFKMGGLPLYANKKAIMILRKDDNGVEHEIEVNAEKILDDGDPDKDVPLENGDRVKVPARRLHLF